MALVLNLLHHQAAMVLAAGGTEGAAAAAAMVTERTIQNWKTRDEFKTLVMELEEDIFAAIKSGGVQLAVVDRQTRLARRNERANMLADRISRAKGGDIGDLVRLLKEERDNEKQAAIEIGDWTEKRELDLRSLSTSQIEELLNAADAGSAPEAS